MTVLTRIAIGSHVWVEDPDEAWIEGEVAQVNGEEITVNCDSGKTVTTKVQNVYPKDVEAPSTGVDDMTKLAYLHEPGVLQNLKSRFDMNEIYTYTGSILIAVNPFQRLPHLYEKNVMQKYKGVPIGELGPHPFAIADAAYRQMINEGISQSILVSGESGAGKTESTKMLMRYLAYMGGKSGTEGRSVEEQVLESNPVLEAFGNAKTVRNNNSSRFGKFVELQFDDRGKISGAAIRTYLLERSRVCQVSDPERNYHCFYMLCAAPPEDVDKYKLGNPRKFHYLNQSNCIELDAINDAEEYIATRKAMEVVGMSPEEQDAIFRVVAAILHLGNIEFSKGSDTDDAEPKDDRSFFHLKTAADLLMCGDTDLEAALCKRVFATRGESITKCLDPEAAALSRDSLAKVVYSRLFDWLVQKINISIGQDPGSKYLIGVLDIYGFESFKINSFEQFCINLTNEKLQQHFNQHVFKMEQEEYTKEEIDWSYVEFIDNQDILDMIEKKPGGIVALLDEACMFPRSTHETFAEKLYKTFNDHKRFSKPKLSRTDFTIHHYAGEVTYQTDFFLDKNKDYVVGDHQTLLSASKCPFVSSLFPPSAEQGSKSSKFSSICTRFKQQLQSLLDTLSATEPHYVRCVKPNNFLKPSIFENQNVLQQLRCGGVLEAIRISCAGFPTRKTFDEFINRFSIIAPEVLKGSSSEVVGCKKLLQKADLKGYQIGKTKVFLRAGQMAQLDAFRNEVLGQSACIIQTKVRSYFVRRKFVSLRNASIQVQGYCRGINARKLYESLRRERASLTIQKNGRMYVRRKSYKTLYSSVVSLQTGIRGMVARCELRLRRRTKAAIKIQAHCRRYLDRVYYLKLKRATIATQCQWRRIRAKRELRKLKLAAIETGNLQEAKMKLEKQVQELTLQLEHEKRRKIDMEQALNQEKASVKQQAMKEAVIVKQDSLKEAVIVKLQEANLKLEKQVQELTLQLEHEKRKKIDMEQALNQEKASVKQQAMKEAVIVKQDSMKEAVIVKLQEANLKLEKQVQELTLQLEHEKRKKIDMEQALNQEKASVKQQAMKEAVIVKQDSMKEAVIVKLQEANLKLEKQVQELTLQLEHEKRKKIDMEQALNQEKASVKQQAVKEAVIVKQDSTKEAVIIKQDSMKEAVIVKQDSMKVPVNGQELDKDLIAENKNLKALVNSLKKKIDESEKKYEERNKQALEAEMQVVQLKASVQRPEEKLADAKSASKIKQQPPSGRFTVDTQEPQSATPSKRSASIVERQREQADALLNCVSENLGFSEGKPVASFTIYKCLIHWNSFVAEKTSVFDRLIQIIGFAIEDKERSDLMAYWLSNTAALLFLLQHTLRTQENPPQQQSFFGRMFKSSPSSINLPIGGFPGVKQVEAKYPALLFKQQLTAYVENIYGIIRENVKKDLSSHISSCIQDPKKSTTSLERSASNNSPIKHSEGIIKCLDEHLSILEENHVPEILVQKIFNQFFSYINEQLLNSLLLHKDYCTFSYGQHIKAALDELETWCSQHEASSWEELKHIRQTIGFLVIGKKSAITYEDIANDLCPILNIQQLYRICTLYWDEDNNTSSVNPEVISSMKEALPADFNDEDTSSFLLDDNSSFPISVDDFSGTLYDMDFKCVKPFTELAENPEFSFLQE